VSENGGKCVRNEDIAEIWDIFGMDE